MNANSRQDKSAEVLSRIEAVCARQEKSPSEVLSLLKRWGIDPERSDEILRQLKAEKYIDENRYAAAFVRDKVRIEHWGFVKIRLALLRKGIPKSLAEKTISEFEPKAYGNMVRSELVKKKKMLKDTSSGCWQKLARFGLSRGYEMEVMYDMLEEICREND